MTPNISTPEGFLSALRTGAYTSEAGARRAVAAVNWPDQTKEFAKAIIKEHFGPEGFRIAIMDITPQFAADALKRNHEDQRGLSASRVTSFANDMKSGNWKLTHQGICFDAQGRLTDGQHRLHAVVESGVTVRMVVSWNSAATMKDPVDVGGKRTVTQLTGLPQRMSAALVLIHRMEQGILATNTPVTVAEIEAAAARHSEEIEILEAQDLPGKTNLVGGIRAAVIWMLPISRKGALEWLREVVTGEMLHRGDAAYAFRQWKSAVGTQVASNHVLFAALNCLRYHILDRQLRSVFTKDTGYRASCAQRRVLDVPHTPDAVKVPWARWGVETNEEDAQE